MHRLFAGIRPPPHLRDALADISDGVDDARWQDDDQLHLTLRFIGEVGARHADEIAQRLARLHWSPFAVAIDGTGTFARRGRPHTLFAGVVRDPALLHLQQKVERACQRAGLPPETRRYHPHVTLARLNRSAGPTGPFLVAHAGLRLQPFTCDSFHLFESRLTPGGAQYEAVMEFPAR